MTPVPYRPVLRSARQFIRYPQRPHKVGSSFIILERAGHENKDVEKSISKGNKNMGHGGEISHHAQCCVLEALEDYRRGLGLSRRI